MIGNEKLTLILTSYQPISLSGVKIDYNRDVIAVKEMEPLDCAEYFLSKIKDNRIDTEDMTALIQENPHQVLFKVMTKN